MHRTAILRFSDAEQSTIDEHRRIVNSGAGCVWWGWWKKDKEPSSIDALNRLQAELRAHPPLRIGLVNRKGAESFHVASCTDIRFSGDGSRMPSPDADLTPLYYRDYTVPAWFKFQQIDAISLADFKREFGVVPYLDPTLYEVFWPDEEDPHSVEVTPGETWNMAPVSTCGEAILHISDLHFGGFHGYPIVAPPPERESSGRPLWQIISMRVRGDLALSIGVVVISGDLVTRGGSSESYAQARDFVDRLLGALSLDNRHCIIVPGNHDLWTEGVEHPTREYAHERPYKDFVEAFFKIDFRGLERVRRFQTPAGRDLVFVELNSARIRSDALKEYGYVAKHRYERLLNYVNESLQEDPGPEPPIVFAVLHHHIIPVTAVDIPDEKRPVSLCLDAGELLDEFQKFGIQFVLHGHQHAPFVGGVTRWERAQTDGSPMPQAIYIIGCGSSGGKRDILPRDLESNTFGVYTPPQGFLDLQVEKYTQTSPPHPYRRLRLPINPRHGVPISHP